MHLSVKTTEVDKAKVAQFRCGYRMGDDFVNTIDEVTCPTCIKQIRKVTR